MEMTRSDILSALITKVLLVHRVDYVNGLSDQCGASIDAIALLHKLVSHDRYRGNASAGTLLVELTAYVDHFKYAKPLTKSAQVSAYHALKAAVTTK